MNNVEQELKKISKSFDELHEKINTIQEEIIRIRLTLQGFEPDY